MVTDRINYSSSIFILARDSAKICGTFYCTCRSVGVRSSGLQEIVYSCIVMQFRLLIVCFRMHYSLRLVAGGECSRSWKTGGEMFEGELLGGELSVSTVTG